MSLGPSQVEAEVDVSPFDLDPVGQANAAALCLHGLTGTPYEVRPIAEELVARGIRARGIWMAGHNGTVQDLAATSQEEWVGLAKQELDRLRADHAKVFLVGVSMGGLVSLRLAETEPVDGLVVVGTPLVLAPPVPQLLPLLRLFQSERPKQGAGIEEPEARLRHPRFPAMPLASVSQLIQLQARVLAELRRVEAPILVAHGRLDQTARPRDAKRIIAEVATPEVDRELLLLQRSGHVATVDYDGRMLARAAGDFLARR
jgi:carboxylesterase